MRNVLFVVLAVAAALARAAQPAPAAYPVDRLELRYAQPHPDAPDLGKAGDLARSLLPPMGGPLLASEIATITAAVRDELARSGGLLGHFVVPDPTQIDPDTGTDLRTAGERDLTILVYLATVGDTRTIAFGRRLPADADPINNSVHARVAAGSPLGSGDLLRRPPLDRYLDRLNRSRGRLVEAAVAPTDTPGAVSLDYLINESRPWTVFAQIANTGTVSTDEIRTLFGARHRQLTGNDDTLRLSYVTAGFDESNAVSLSYDRPLDDDGRFRFRVGAAYNEYTATDVGLALPAFEGDGIDVFAELTANVAQHGSGFVDVFAGLQLRDIRVNNLLAGTDAETQLLLARAGVRYERFTRDADTLASVSVETNLPDIIGTDADELNLLGRPNADTSFTVLRFDASQGVFLESLFTDAPASRAHRLTVSVRGQWTPDARLVANEQVIAGGLFTVRGYEEAVASGDSAIIGSIEYRFGLSAALPVNPEAGSLFGRDFRGQRQTLDGTADWDIGLRAFVDYAVVNNNDATAFETDEQLVGAGIGLDARLWNNITARVDYAVALSDVDALTNPTDQGDSRLHFLVLVSY